MNSITNDKATIVAQAAKIEWLETALRDIYAYGMAGGYTSEQGNPGYVDGFTVANKATQAQSNADTQYAEAWFNEVGPGIADGGHCSWMGKRYVPRCQHTGITVNGYHCPECGLALPGERNDTPDRADERMRKHWVATHKTTGATT